MVNAPAPYGARRPPETDTPFGGGAGDDWSQATSVRSASARDNHRDTHRDTHRDSGLIPTRPVAPERGLPAWGALLVLLAIAGLGGVIDTISGSQVRGGFNIGIVVASVIAMLLVRRTSMFPVVIAPPLVYSLASASMLYLRSGGLHDKKVLFDGAANWLVYGFPAIAAATAAVLIIAGVRLITHR
ncbi:MAG: DUF6542 domain-containing protein [Pseudonocardiales bacterium]